MIIAQITDTHLAFDAPEGERRIGDFARVVDDINRLDPVPDVIVHTGDIVHNGRPDEYAEAAAILARANAPVYVMAGNKDNRANLLRTFSSAGYLGADGPFIDYAVEDFPLRLIMLDTLSARSNKGDFCAARLARLAALIDADRDKPIVVFAHHPPIEVLVGPDRYHFEDLHAMQALGQELMRSGRVIQLVCGHVHRPYVGHIGSIPVTIATCVATALRRGDYPEAAKSKPLYALHRYDAASGFSTESRIACSTSEALPR
jgi:Icc protein